MVVHWGRMSQIAWVVADIEKAERLLTQSFGIQKWNRMLGIEFGPEMCRYRGSPSDHSAHISLAYLGGMQLELIEPIRGESIYTEFLKSGGAGIHHFCFEPENFDATIAQLEEHGRPVVQSGNMGGAMKFAYIEGVDFGAPYIEFAEIGKDMQKLFSSMKNENQ